MNSLTFNFLNVSFFNYRGYFSLLEAPPLIMLPISVPWSYFGVLFY